MATSTRLLIPALLLLLTLSGCANRTVSGLRFQPQNGWTEEPSDSAVRVASYRLPDGQDEALDAELIVYYFGLEGAGSVAENIERWKDHFEPADGGMLNVESDSRTRAGLQLDEIAMKGTYVAPIRPGAEDRHHKPEHAMLGTIVTTDAGPYYVKLVGPEATVEKWTSSYKRFIASMRPAPVVTGAVANASHP